MEPVAEVFLEVYGKTLDKSRALRDSGLPARMLRKLTEPRFAEYHQGFTERYLEIEDELRAEMVNVAREVTQDPKSRQKLNAAKFIANECQIEVERVEKAHVRWLENQAKERKLGSSQFKELGDGAVSLEEVKRGSGSFAKLRGVG